jgi:hypothetical protein
VLNHTDDLMVPIHNHLDEDDLDGTGIDAAVDALSDAVKGQASVDDHPERRRKVRVGELTALLALLNAPRALPAATRCRHYSTHCCSSLFAGTVQCILRATATDNEGRPAGLEAVAVQRPHLRGLEEIAGEPR